MVKILKLLEKFRPKKNFANPDFVTFLALCDSEINFCIRYLGNGEVELLLGSEKNGFTDRSTYCDIEKGLSWLTEVAARRYPDTWYAEMYQTLRRSMNEND